MCKRRTEERRTEEGRTEGRTESGGMAAKKLEPHTEMWGKNTLKIDTCALEHLSLSESRLVVQLGAACKVRSTKHCYKLKGFKGSIKILCISLLLLVLNLPSWEFDQTPDLLLQPWMCLNLKNATYPIL